MPNANRPEGTTDCDHRGYTGCISCGCSECGVLVDRDTLRPLTLPTGRVVYACPTCLTEGESDGVPEPIDADTAEAQTVRLPREPIGADGLGEVLAERGREIAAERKAVAV
jgi:hypothetical protein